MHFHSLLLGLLAAAIPSVTATALTYKLEANEKACFFAEVDQQNAKLAFYFAVSTQSLEAIGTLSFLPIFLFSGRLGAQCNLEYP